MKTTILPPRSKWISAAIVLRTAYTVKFEKYIFIAARRKRPDAPRAHKKAPRGRFPARRFFMLFVFIFREFPAAAAFAVARPARAEAFAAFARLAVFAARRAVAGSSRAFAVALDFAHRGYRQPLFLKTFAARFDVGRSARRYFDDGARVAQADVADVLASESEPIHAIYRA